MLKVLYSNKNTWELDYFKSLINLEFEFYDILKGKGQEIFILVASHKDSVLPFCKTNKVNLVFYLGNEDHSKNDFLEIAKYSKLFCQYRHLNCYQLPLGYCSGMELVNDVIKIKDRKYDFSFIGSPKHDRINLIEFFKKEFPNCYLNYGSNCWDINKQKVGPLEMSRIYQQSRFVIIGRGWISLDCFRIYEAIVCGAIPVVIGPLEEIDKTFYYNGEPPEFIYAEDALSAINKIKSVELQVLQEKLMDWWKNQNNKIINLITNEKNLATSF